MPLLVSSDRALRMSIGRCSFYYELRQARCESLVHFIPTENLENAASRAIPRLSDSRRQSQRRDMSCRKRHVASKFRGSFERQVKLNSSVMPHDSHGYAVCDQQEHDKDRDCKVGVGHCPSNALSRRRYLMPSFFIRLRRVE